MKLGSICKTKIERKKFGRERATEKRKKELVEAVVTRRC